MSHVYYAQVGDVLIEVYHCGACGVLMGVPRGFLADRQKDGAWIYCPNGHKTRYRETEAKQLKRQIKRLRCEKDEAVQCCDAALEDAQHQANRVRGYQGALVSQRKRLTAGSE